MTEYAPNEILSNIHADIARAEKEAQEVKRIEEILVKKSEELYSQANEVLRWGGNTKSGFVGAGSERGDKVGFRYERGDYLKTPPVTIELGDKKADLVLSEVLKGASVFTESRRGIQLTAKFNNDPKKEPKQFFYMDISGESKNWLGKTATLEQMDMIKSVLSLMKKSLPKGNRSEGIRDLFEKLPVFRSN